ncbi:imidazole glycerol phosphate synthase subunit HisH [Acuticoccus sp.]|uniref:imidazole glycerol phosphate synthase subunit HisH n=1 Tax=Acuticoccus sp. TaxID=1904378 RepID=UPI003B526C64
MSVVIVDYGSGNLRSAQKAFIRAAGEAELSNAIVVSADPIRIARAERIVLPGVGAFADCMMGLSSTPGMVDAILDAVTHRAIPLLGVCVGMQLLATRGLEHTVTPGLDLIRGEVRRIEPRCATLKVPHMGWNTLSPERAHPVLEGIPLGDDGLHAYFVHSYAIVPERPEDVLALSYHGDPFAAVVARDTVVGTQFHPEKSQALGLRLIANFLKWQP